MEGEFRFIIGEHQHQLKKSDVLLAPKDIGHTYLITSTSEGSWLTITNGKEFEHFIKKICRTVNRIELPQRSGAPSKEAIDRLSKTAKEFNIEIVGPPLH